MNRQSLHTAKIHYGIVAHCNSLRTISFFTAHALTPIIINVIMPSYKNNDSNTYFRYSTRYVEVKIENVAFRMDQLKRESSIFSRSHVVSNVINA
jgi:hypothetical protein